MRLLTAAPLLLCVAIGLTAQNKAEAEKPASPVLAELFTSQGCSSCPPAEAYFAKLAERENVITIEWHVDYWDTLVHRGSKWEDPFSKPGFTARQRNYNRALRGTGGVYTPQAVINGASEGVGSRPKEVEPLLRNAKPLSISIMIEDGVAALSEAVPKVATVTFVRLLEQQSTSIEGGENKGRQLSGRNIAVETIALAQSVDRKNIYKLPELEPGQNCAVIVQVSGNSNGHILGAATCH